MPKKPVGCRDIFVACRAVRALASVTTSSLMLGAAPEATALLAVATAVVVAVLAMLVIRDNEHQDPRIGR
jgi:hypothetical protein